MGEKEKELIDLSDEKQKELEDLMDEKDKEIWAIKEELKTVTGHLEEMTKMYFEEKAKQTEEEMHRRQIEERDRELEQKAQIIEDLKKMIVEAVSANGGSAQVNPLRRSAADSACRKMKTKASGADFQPQPSGYECSECNKRYQYKSQLVKHMRCHNGERPFTCEICDKRFSETSNLNNHLRSVHSGDRNFPCHICHKTFTLLGNLKKHLEMHTRQQADSYPCEFPGCSSVYTTEKRLGNHLRLKHKRQ